MPLHQVWIPSETDVYELAIVQPRKDKMATPNDQEVHVITHDGISKDVNEGDVVPFDPSHLQDCDNLCFMSALHEAPLIHGLHNRFKEDKIYTHVGNILISMNPYRDIKGLYDSPLAYLNLPNDEQNEVDDLLHSQETAPHIYTTANNALKAMMKDYDIDSVITTGLEFTNQSIIISGESGSGKTEAAKHVMKFLIAANDHIVANAESIGSKPVTNGLGDRVHDVLVESNIVFESFGNAKTVRNNNSSRFGKYIKLQYTQDNQLIGAHTNTFLLEKSRLHSVSRGERNYHVFYQLVRGLSALMPNIAKCLMISSVENFAMLNKGGCTVLNVETDDADEFGRLVQALKTLSCTDDEVQYLWSLLACILHMGNIECTNESNGEQCLLSCATASIEWIASALGLEPAAFTECLTRQKMRAARRNSAYSKVLSQEETRGNLAALLKWLYNTLFNWLVRKINFAHNVLSVSAERQSEKHIGILDIFGFEMAEESSFEQLCINYASERLQQYFNEHIFVYEQMHYASEGVDIKTVTYRDNQPLIDLIGKKPIGLLAILEEHCMLARKPDDSALLHAYNQAHEKNPLYSRPRFGNDSFIVKHYAGDVTYAVSSFLEKNTNSLQVDLSELLNFTTNVFLRNVMGLEALTSSADGLKSSPIPRVQPQVSPGPDSAASQSPMTAPMKSPMKSPAGRLRCNSPVRVRPPSADMENIPPRNAGLIMDGMKTPSAKMRQALEGTEGKTSTKNAEAATTASGKNKFAAAMTVSYQFRAQLDDLMKTLKQTKPHYVKCIKSNTTKSADVITPTIVMEQLRYSGVLEVVRIRREGFPVRVSFLEFYTQYRALSIGNGKEWMPPKECINLDAKEYVIDLANTFLPDDSYLVGSNILFLKDGSYYCMQKALASVLNSHAVVLERHLRGYAKRKRYGDVLKAKKMIRLRPPSPRRASLLAESEPEKSEITVEETSRRQDQAAHVITSALRRYTRRLHLRHRIRHLHHAVETGDLDTVSAHLELEPDDIHLLDREHDFSSVYVTAVRGNQPHMLAFLRYRLQGLFTRSDVLNNKAMHAAAMTPQWKMFYSMGAVIDEMNPVGSGSSRRGSDAWMEENMLSRFASNMNFVTGTSPQRASAGTENVLQKGRGAMLTVGEQKALAAKAKEKANRRGSLYMATKAPATSKESKKLTNDIGTLFANPDRLVSGWLERKRERGEWKRKWCVLTQKELVYFTKDTDEIPKCVIPLRDCTFHRVMGDIPALEIFSPHMKVKRTFFGGTMRNVMQFRMSSEFEYQTWMFLLRGVTGSVKPIQRNVPIKYHNREIRQAAASCVDKGGNTPLHTLAKSSTQVMQEGTDDEVVDVFAAMQWLIDSGCPVDVVNADEVTAAEIADNEGNEDLVEWMEGITVGSMWTKLLPPPTKLPRFSFVRIQFLKLVPCEENTKSLTLDRYKDLSLTIEVFNARQVLQEKSQTVDSFALVRPTCAWVGATCHMQVPLENVETGSYVSLKLMATAKRGTSATAAFEYFHDSFFIDKATFEAGLRKIFLRRPDAADGFWLDVDVTMEKY